MNLQIEDDGGFNRVEIPPAQWNSLLRLVNRSATYWTARVDGELGAVWGLVPPTILSDTAYLWLLTTKASVGHEFLLARYSKLWIERMQKIYPNICGHCFDPKAQRWLKWLGAKVEPSGEFWIQHYG